MKIPNYDPGFSKSSYKQGDPCMPTDVFRMLICGPGNSGKTNILLHMLYMLLVFDKIYLFAKNLHQNKYQASFAGLLLNESTPRLVTRSSRLPVMKSFHSGSYRWTTKNCCFGDLVCESNQNSIINYFINGRHRNCCVIYLTQTFYKVPKISGITAAIFVFSNFFHEKTSGLRTR